MLILRSKSCGDFKVNPRIQVEHTITEEAVVVMVPTSADNAEIHRRNGDTVLPSIGRR